VGDARLDTAELEAALRRHLDDGAPSLVSALDGEGFFLPLPESLPLGPHQEFRVGHPMEAVAPGDAQVMIDAWELALSDGFGRCQVGLVDGTRAEVSIYDVRADHGSFVAVASPIDGDLDPNVGVDPDRVPERPKVCRFLKDERASITYVDAAALPMLGLGPADLLGRRQLDFVHSDDVDAVVRTWITLLSNPDAIQRLRIRHRCGDGSYLWVEMVNQNRLHDPAHGDIACDLIDISEQVEAERSLAERERELRAVTDMLTRLTESLPSGVAQIDSGGALHYANARLFELLGAGEVDDLAGLLRCVEQRQRTAIELAVLGTGPETRAATEVEAEVLGGDGATLRVCQFVVRPLGDDGASGVVLSVHDVTASVRQRATLKRQATLDPLTQCPNRAVVLEALEQALADRAPGQGAAVLFVDLDEFKLVNDRFGHATGDQVLQTVADRLRATVRAGDLVGRMGGDEFVVVCPNVPTVDQVDDMIRRIDAALGVVAELDGAEVVVGASVGGAWANDEITASEMLHRADQAMYRSKGSTDGLT
jgi:diguanylate cyclase (GGDEF)-like protein/PAS domain S-box-containing protein